MAIRAVNRKDTWTRRDPRTGKVVTCRRRKQISNRSNSIANDPVFNTKGRLTSNDTKGMNKEEKALFRKKYAELKAGGYGHEMSKGIAEEHIKFYRSRGFKSANDYLKYMSEPTKYVGASFD